MPAFRYWMLVLALYQAYNAQKPVTLIMQKAEAYSRPSDTLKIARWNLDRRAIHLIGVRRQDHGAGPPERRCVRVVGERPRVCILRLDRCQSQAGDALRRAVSRAWATPVSVRLAQARGSEPGLSRVPTGWAGRARLPGHGER